MLKIPWRRQQPLPILGAGTLASVMQALLLVPTCARPPCPSGPPGLEPPSPGRSSPQEVLGEPPLPEAPEDGQQGCGKCISTGRTTDTLSVGICFHPSFFFFPQISASVFVFVLIFSYFPMLGSRCCAWAFSSCSEQRLLSSCRVWASHCGGFSCCRTWLLDMRAS